jgi:hypothetical protein
MIFCTYSDLCDVKHTPLVHAQLIIHACTHWSLLLYHPPIFSNVLYTVKKETRVEIIHAPWPLLLYHPPIFSKVLYTVKKETRVEIIHAPWPLLLYHPPIFSNVLYTVKKTRVVRFIHPSFNKLHC